MAAGEVRRALAAVRAAEQAGDRDAEHLARGEWAAAEFRRRLARVNRRRAAGGRRAGLVGVLSRRVGRMFGYGGKPVMPPERDFAHEDRCRMRDAQPEWIDEGGGLWTRACRCTYEQWRAPIRVERRPGPDVSKHRHDPDCPAPAMVKEWPDGGKCTFCPTCGTYTHELRLPSDPFDRAERLAGLVI